MGTFIREVGGNIIQGVKNTWAFICALPVWVLVCTFLSAVSFALAVAYSVGVLAFIGTVLVVPYLSHLIAEVAD
jgi:hypothetical protein